MPAGRDVPEIVAASFACVADRGETVYVCVPITTGLRELQMMRRLGCTRADLRTRYADLWLEEVVKPNERAAQAFVARVRARSRGAVVDPSQLVVADWTQPDYWRMWDLVIRSTVGEVVASPGWEYSVGSRREIGLALDLQLRITDLDGNVLNADAIREADSAAGRSLSCEGWTTTEIEALLPPIASLTVQPGKQPPIERIAANLAPSDVLAWLVGERGYQVAKFGTDLDDQHTLEGIDVDSWWDRQLGTYLHRARLLGLTNANGRQALAKFVATGAGLLESVIRLYGPLTKPGVSSGQLEVENATKCEHQAEPQVS